MIISPKLLPTVLLVEDVAVAVVYAINRDVRKAVYWLAAAVIIACITY